MYVIKDLFDRQKLTRIQVVYKRLKLSYSCIINTKYNDNNNNNYGMFEGFIIHKLSHNSD